MGPGWLRRALRAPLLHFLLLGGLLSVLRPSPPPQIVLSGADVERIRSEFAAEAGRLPEAAELEALLDRAVEEEILLDEARAAGRDAFDGIVATRLARLGRFLGPDADEAPEASVARARELGLDRSDPVIRRYLLEHTRLAIAGEADATTPPDDVLEAYLRHHADRFRQPERLRLRQVYVSARRGDATERARALGERLRAGAGPDLGDPFPHGPELVASRVELDRIFGAGFAARLEITAVGRWQGPVPSAHGLHWVWLDTPIPASLPALPEVRSRILQEILDERREEHLRARLADLRAGYAVRIESPLAAP